MDTKRLLELAGIQQPLVEFDIQNTVGDIFSDMKKDQGEAAAIDGILKILNSITIEFEDMKKNSQKK